MPQLQLKDEVTPELCPELSAIKTLPRRGLDSKVLSKHSSVLVVVVRHFNPLTSRTIVDYIICFIDFVPLQLSVTDLVVEVLHHRRHSTHWSKEYNEYLSEAMTRAMKV